MVCQKCRKEIPDDAAFCCYCGKSFVRKERRSKRRPGGTGCIKKRTDKTRKKPYEVRKNGEAIGSFETKEAAQKFLDKLNGKPQMANAINWTLDDVHEFWLNREYLELDADTKGSYDNAWKKFGKIKNLKMRDVNTETVQVIVDEAKDKKQSRSTQEKIRSVYSLLCQVAMEKDIIDRNYADFLRLGAQEAVQRDVFTPEEIDLVVKDAATCDTSKIIAILLYTGLRISELMQMPLDCVNMDRWFFRHGIKTEAGRERLVPILPTIQPFVRYFVGCATGPTLLSGYEGNQTVQNFRRRDYYPALERLGIRTPDRPMRPHSCRYTLATRSHSADVDDDSLRKIMGHADYNVTSDIYIQPDLDKLQAEFKKLDKDATERVAPKVAPKVAPNGKT